MKNIHLISFFIIIFLFVPFAFPFPTDAAAKYPEGTKIGELLVAGQTEEDLITSLSTEIALWQNGEDILLKSDVQTFQLSRAAFQFDVHSTISKLNDKTKRSWKKFFMRPKDVEISLDVTINEEDESVQLLRSYDYIDADATLEAAKQLASTLTGGESVLKYKDADNLPVVTIKEIELEIPEGMSDAVMSYAVKEIHDYVIASNESFSFLKVVTFPGDLNFSNQEMSFLASSLYELLLHTNVDFIEKHIPVSLSSYHKPGLAVDVNRKKAKDFIVLNNSSLPLKIVAKKNQNRLTLMVQTFTVEDTYKYEVIEVEEIKPRTIYRYSDLVNPGEQEILQNGENGAKVKVERITYANNNILKNRDLIAEEIYVPKPTIIAISSEEPEELDSTDDVNTEDEFRLQDDETDSFDLGNLGVGDFIPDDVEQQTDNMRDFANQINDLLEERNLTAEDDALLSSILLLAFLEELELLTEQLTKFDERLKLIEEEINGPIKENSKKLESYQTEIKQLHDDLNTRYEELLAMILDISPNGEEK